MNEATGARITIDGELVKSNDGRDRIYGDRGPDWLVGGTERDWLFGGFGDDVHNADDNLDTGYGVNDDPENADTRFRDGDIVYGGAGRDVLIGNTGRDRLFDWTGFFNSFYVPFEEYGPPTVNRWYTLAFHLFIRRLALAGGADVLLTPNEPYDEPAIFPLGSPDSPQVGPPRWPDVPHNVPGVRRDDIRGTDPVCVCWTPLRGDRTTGRRPAVRRAASSTACCSRPACSSPPVGCS